MSNRFGSPYVSAVISCALAIYLIITSWPIYKFMHQVNQNPAHQFLSQVANVADKVTSFFGLGKTGAGKLVLVMLRASGITLGMGALQAISSLSLPLGAAKQYRGPVLTSSFISFFGSLLCLGSWYATQAYFPMLEDDWARNTLLDSVGLSPLAMKRWQWTTLADGVFLFFSFCHSVSFERSMAKRRENLDNYVDLRTV